DFFLDDSRRLLAVAVDDLLYRDVAVDIPPLPGVVGATRLNELAQAHRRPGGSLLGVVDQGGDAARDGHGDRAKRREHPSRGGELSVGDIGRVDPEVAGRQAVDLIAVDLGLPRLLRVADCGSRSRDVLVETDHAAAVLLDQLVELGLTIVALLGQPLPDRVVALVLRLAARHYALLADQAARVADRLEVLLVSLGLGLDVVPAVVDPAPQFPPLVALARVRLVALADQIRLMVFALRQQETGRAYRLEPQLHD